jgi:hypothetical protein
MISPRPLRRRRRANASVLKTLLVVAFLVLTATCALHLTRKILILRKPSSEPNRSLQVLDDSYPGAFVDLWPDDKNTEDYRHTLLNCIPGLDDSCQLQLEKKPGDDNPLLRVALVRPPGVLGDVFVEYVQKVLNLHAEKTHPIELVPTTGIIDANHDYSIIVRLVTLPPLLEVCDTVLKRNLTDKPSLDDLMGLVRYSIRFQCHITQRTQDTALFTVTLDRMMGFSSSTTKKLQKLFGITPHPDSKKNRVDLKDLPLVIMDRVSSASALVQSVAPAPKMISILSQIMEEEVRNNKDGSCLPLPNTVLGKSMG